MSKVRCSGCRDYFDKDTIWYRRGPISVCSPGCLPKGPKPRRNVKGKARRPDIPPNVRQDVLARDGGCRHCGTKQSLHVHHIEYRSQGGTHEPANLIVLCDRHHELAHSNKRQYQPLLRGLIWKQYFEGQYLTVPQFERWLNGRGGATR